MANMNEKKQAASKTNAEPVEPADSESASIPLIQENMPVPASNPDMHAAEIAQLRELTEALIGAVNSLKSANQRNPELSNLIESVGAATRAIAEQTPVVRTAVTPSIAPPQAEHRVNEYGAVVKDDCGCGCGPYDCLSSSCCKFKIEITHARAIEMQLPTEILDSNVNPFGELDIRFFASIDGVGAIYPNMFDTFGLRKNLLKQGMWVQISCYVGTVDVCKGKPKAIAVDIDAIEADLSAGGAEVIGIRDEYGTASAPLTLDCCTSVPLITTVEVHLDHNGLGGGAIELRIRATKICC